MNKLEFAWRIIKLATIAIVIISLVKLGVTSYEDMLSYFKTIGLRITQYKIF